MQDTTLAMATRGRATFRPTITGTHYMVSSTHYLATAAANRILQEGGNAIDAGVAAGLCVAVLERDLTDFGGVAPILIYSAREERVISISGLGRWPKAASVEWFERQHDGTMPVGIPRAVTPAAPDAWLQCLERYGTMTFGQVAQPAIELAEDGFPVFPRLAKALASCLEVFEAWPTSKAIFMPNGRLLGTGDVLVQKDLGHTFRALAQAERSAGGDRVAGLRAAHDLFYRGEIARQIVRFCQEQGGVMTEEDLATYRSGNEPPAHTRYRGVDVYACGPWNQGPTLPLALNLLEGFDLQRLGWGSSEYLHVLIECMNLAFADREAFIGDPDFVDVPLAGMLSKEYAAERRELISMERAFGKLPPPGNPWAFQGGGGRRLGEATGVPERPSDLDQPDTSFICVFDREGNVFSATPSDPCANPTHGAPVVEGLGIIISGRGIQSRLERGHPAAVAPGKRPRMTPNPAMALKDGKPYLGWGSPGGDGQIQAMIQVFLNMVDFGLDPQEAIERPRAFTHSFPQSFYPHAMSPGRARLEARLGEGNVAALCERGHRAEIMPDWTPRGCGVCLVEGRSNGTFAAGADPRRECYAAGW
jgi:gamma-glutamyltranspeptidase/glutathione hydrolase